MQVPSHPSPRWPACKERSKKDLWMLIDIYIPKVISVDGSYDKQQC